MSDRTRQYVNIAENTVMSEVILILEITSAAPLRHKHADRIRTLFNSRCNIKLSLQMASLCIADILTVYPNSCVRGNALKYNVLLHCIIVNFKFALIYTARIFIGNIRHIYRERISHVCVIRVLVSAHLPA